MRRFLALPLLLATLPAHAADAPSDMDLLANAIETGSIAATKGKKGARKLADASALIAALGAKPVEGGDDLATRWHAQAVATGKIKSAPPLRGRLLGPSYRELTLSAAKPFETAQLFLAGQWAEVRLSPTKGQGVGLEVSDAAGKPVCSGASAPLLKCRWLPVFSARYTIRAISRAASESKVFLLTN